MRQLTLIITWLALNLSLFTGKTHAQDSYKRGQLVGGLSYCAAQGNVILNKNAFGLELGAMRQKSQHYSFGISADFIFASTQSHDVHVPNNLMTEESLEPFLVLFGLTTVHHVDLNPEAKVKFFVEGKAGVRLANYSVTHYGYLLFVKTEDKMYNDTSFGLCLGLSSGFIIPLDTDSRYSLRLKTGLQIGTPVKYVDIYYHDDMTFSFSEQRKSNATYWQTSVDLIWRF